MLRDPTRMVDAQMKFWQGYAQLWGSATRRLLGEEATPVITPGDGDRRFKDDAWQENPVFDFIKQSYLLASRYVDDCVSAAGELDEHTAKKVAHLTRSSLRRAIQASAAASSVPPRQ
jgi:polyhydroxyalkanoate synthase